MRSFLKFINSTAGLLTAISALIVAVGGLVALNHHPEPSGPGTYVPPVPVPYASTSQPATPASIIPAPPQPAAKPAPVVMGQLEAGINRQGNDFDAFGKHADNAQLCAEMCRTDKACDAMTFVISRNTCWLKHGVPDPSQDNNMTSAVKVEQPAP